MVLESQVYNNLKNLAYKDTNLSGHLRLRDQRYFVSKIGEISANDTLHAHKRKLERGITSFMVAIAIHYGSKEVHLRKNKTYIKYSVHKKNLNKTLFEKYSNSLDGLIIVVDKVNPNLLITTYFKKFIPNNVRTVSEDSYFKKKSNKAYKRLKNYQSAISDGEY